MKHATSKSWQETAKDWRRTRQVIKSKYGRVNPVLMVVNQAPLIIAKGKPLLGSKRNTVAITVGSFIHG